MARKRGSKDEQAVPPAAPTTAPAPEPAKRERRATSSRPKPSPAEVASEAASIYPDTFDTPPSPAEIAAEAYAIYQARGGSHGSHNDDWLEAERRIRERRQKTERR